jgi:hypothetical protein
MEADRKRILDDPPTGDEDPMERWRRQSEAFEAECKAAARERRAAEQRHRDIRELRAEVEALKDIIAEGDAVALAAISDTILPLVETIGDTLRKAIDDLHATVQKRLSVLESEVRGHLPPGHHEAADLPFKLTHKAN